LCEHGKPLQEFHATKELKHPMIEKRRMNGFPDVKTAIGKLDRLSPDPGHYEFIEPYESPGESLQDREHKPGDRAG
jgi:hypothetical protein